MVQFLHQIVFMTHLLLVCFIVNFQQIASSEHVGLNLSIKKEINLKTKII